jgi:hypothetical protein
VTPIRIYVEGGGASKFEKITLRQGFEAFFAKVGRGIGVHPCGGLVATHSTFERALDADPRGHKLLLVDSDGPVDREPKHYLRERWGWHCGGDGSQYHLMVEAFEAWLVADVDALTRFYGSRFRPGELPMGYATVEAVPKAELARAVVAATHQSSEGTYEKIDHASKLLGLLDPQTVRDASYHCNRLFSTLEAKLSELTLAPG